MGERGLAHEAERHDASGNAHQHAIRIEFLGGFRGIGGDHLRNGVGEVVAARIAFLPESLNLLEFSAAEFVDVLVESQKGPFVNVRDCAARAQSAGKRETRNKDYKQARILVSAAIATPPI